MDIYLNPKNDYFGVVELQVSAIFFSLPWQYF